MLENQLDNLENSEKVLENNSQADSSDSISKDNSDQGEILGDNSEINSKKLKDNSNNSEDISSTDARLEQLEKEHETLKNQYVRIAADFDNFRKRQSRDQDDLKIQLISKSLSAILPIVDNFERARQQLKPENDEAQTLHRSYQGLYKQLVEVLKQQGVSPMRVLGQQFDPNLHEAVLREPSDKEKEDIIIEELQRGYHLDGKVLRHALVKVSMGPGPSQDSREEIEKDKVEEDIITNENLTDEK
tara:strand:- start:27 stop:761 length:735 start_codon:yes stop_codon:yes gene_type:complete